MFTDQEKEALLHNVVERFIREVCLDPNGQVEPVFEPIRQGAPADKADQQEDPKCWIIQYWVMRLNTGSDYLRLGAYSWVRENFPGYDTPMTHAQMVAAKIMCKSLFPQYEFIEHLVAAATDPLRGIL